MQQITYKNKNALYKVLEHVRLLSPGTEVLSAEVAGAVGIVYASAQSKLSQLVDMGVMRMIRPKQMHSPIRYFRTDMNYTLVQEDELYKHSSSADGQRVQEFLCGGKDRKTNYALAGATRERLSLNSAVGRVYTFFNTRPERQCAVFLNKGGFVVTGVESYRYERHIENDKSELVGIYNEDFDVVGLIDDMRNTQSRENHAEKRN